MTYSGMRVNNGVHVHMSACIFLRMCTSACMSTYVHVHVYTCMCIHMHVCVRPCAHVHVCAGQVYKSV